MDIKTKFNLGQKVWIVKEYYDKCSACGWNTAKRGHYPWEVLVVQIDIEISFVHDKRPQIIYKTQHEGDFSAWALFTTKEDAIAEIERKLGEK